MEAGQVRSIYMTMMYSGVKEVDGGAVLHEIQIRKDGKPLMKSTQKKPIRPDRLLFDQTELSAITPFISCERIGSKFYLFAGPHYKRGYAVTKLAYIYDPKSSGELVKFHDLPSVGSTAPVILSAHGRLYHLGIPFHNLPMPFEVYNPSTRSWDPLPPQPPCQFIPYEKAPRYYMGYAVWGTCILFSFGYPSLNKKAIIFVPVLFNAESETWHQVYADQLGPFFPWREKAVVVGDAVYALGSKRNSIISFSINKSGSEEDGTLVYSLIRPYRLEGLDIIPHPNYMPSKRSVQFLAPLGDLEFCLVQSTNYALSQYQPLWITTFRIILNEGTFSKIQTLHSTLQFLCNQDYGHFWPMYCYNPDYEPKEAMLTTTRKGRINKKEYSSQKVDCNILDTKPKEAISTDREENGHKEISCTCTVDSSMRPFELSEDGLENIEKVDMQEETSPCNIEHLKLDFELLGGSSTGLKGENSPGMVDSNSSRDYETKESVLNKKQARRRKRKGKHSKKKGTKRDSYIVSLVKHQISRAKSHIEGRRCLRIACLVMLFIDLLYLF